MLSLRYLRLVPATSSMVSTGIPISNNGITNIFRYQHTIRYTTSLNFYCTFQYNHTFTIFLTITSGNRTPASRVANPVETRHSNKLSNLFQLMHTPRGNHAQSIASNGDQKEDKTLLQHSQLSQYGEFRYISVSE